MPVRQPSNSIPVIAIDSLTPPNPNKFQALQPNVPQIAPNTTQCPDSGREDTSNPTSELNQSQKRKEPPTTSQREMAANSNGVDLQDMFNVDRSTLENREVKRMKMEADSKRELFLLQIQYEKEREARNHQWEKELQERRHKWEKELEERRYERERQRESNMSVRKNKMKDGSNERKNKMRDSIGFWRTLSLSW